jgi:cell wall-associated NlpC family hydrolase
VVDLRVEVADSGARVSGRVLTRRQLAEVTEIARRHSAGLAVEVVADPAAGLEEGWLGIEREVVDVWRTPSGAGDDRARQTQYLPADGPLRLLGGAGGAWLVQGPDLAMGWVSPEGLADAAAEQARARWAALVRAEAGAAVLPEVSRRTGGDVRDGHGDGGGLLPSLVADARTHLGVPYLWGGTTPAGYDCSGLVQRVFLRATGVWLPKHTSEQRRVGPRVIEPEARPGDLLFATLRGRKIGHVLILTARDRVIHACRSELRVIEESMEENARRYQHQGFRRPVVMEAG